MRLYVDTVDRREAEEAVRSGLVYGITSNPFLFRSGLDKPLLRLVEELLPYVGNEFHVQVPGRSGEEYFRNGQRVFELDPKRIVVKIPTHREGVEGMRLLKEVGVRVTATAVTTVHQAIAVALLGVDYVAPFMARADESGYSGSELIRGIAEVYRVHGVKTLIIAASIRNPVQVVEAFRAGAHAVTVKHSLFRELAESPASRRIIGQMNEIWSRTELGW